MLLENSKALAKTRLCVVYAYLTLTPDIPGCPESPSGPRGPFKGQMVYK